MTEKTIYDLPDMAIKSYKKSLLEQIALLEAEHRAILVNLRKLGKSYRSRSVTFENGYLSALLDVSDNISRHQKNTELREAIGLFSKKMKW